MSTSLEENTSEEVPRPKLSRFALSLLSLLVPVGALVVENTAGYLAGYLSVLIVTFPAGLSFKGSGMKAESLGSPGPTYEKQRRFTQWIFLASSGLALACAARFAIAVS